VSAFIYISRTYTLHAMLASARLAVAAVVMLWQRYPSMLPSVAFLLTCHIHRDKGLAREDGDFTVARTDPWDT